MAFTIGAEITVTSGTEDLLTMLQDVSMTSAERDITTSGHLSFINIYKKIIVSDGAILTILQDGIYQFYNSNTAIQLAINSSTTESGRLIVGTDDGPSSINGIVIHIQKDGDTFNPENGLVDPRAESIMEFYGCTIVGRSAWGTDSGVDDPSTCIMKGVKWITNDADDQYRLLFGSGNLNVDTVQLKKGVLFLGRNWTALDNITISDTTSALQSNWGGNDTIASEYVIKGIKAPRVTNLIEIATYPSTTASSPSGYCAYGSNYDIRNYVDGDLDVVVPRQGTWDYVRSVGTVLKSLDFNINAKQFEDDSDLDAFFFAFDSDSGNRTTSFESDNTTADDTGLPIIHHWDRDLEWYSQLASGTYETVIQGGIFNRPLSHYNSSPTVAPVWDSRLPIKCVLSDYDRIAKAFAINSLTGAQSQTLALELDVNVTDTRANALAYADITFDWTAKTITCTSGATPQKIYNKYKAEMTLQVNGKAVYNGTHTISWDGTKLTASGWVIIADTFTSDTANALLDGFVFDSCDVHISATQDYNTTIQNSTDGVVVDTIATYNFSNWVFSTNTNDITVGDSTGAVTIVTGGKTFTIDEGTGNTVTIDDSVSIFIKVSEIGSALLWRNISLWKTWTAQYADDATAQTANPTPNIGDYYRTDANLYGRWDGSSWITGVSRIDGDYIASTYLMGVGTAETEEIKVPPNSDIRISANKGEWRMNLKDVNSGTSSQTVELVLNINPDIDPTYFASALPIASAFEVSTPNANGTVTVGFPATANGMDELTSLAVIELIRDAEDSMSGAITLNNNTLITASLAQTVFKDDTVKLEVASGEPNNTLVQIPLNFVFENYTIDPNPTDPARCTKVIFDLGAKNPTAVTQIIGQDWTKVSDLSSLALESTVAEVLVDTNELQTNQGAWVTATGFSTFNPATDTVARVTLVDTTTSNTDMRGTDGANTVTPIAPDNSSIADILADTNELQQNQGNWLTATNVIADNMRGTDGANTITPNTVVPDNASITAILADTNELQQNQGNWLTATGFATPENITAQTADLKGASNKDLTQVFDNSPTIDLTPVTDAIDAQTVDLKGASDKDLTEVFNNTPDVNLDPVLDAISNLKDFDPVNDTVARVSLVDVTTTNTDQRGTDGANTVAPDNAGIAQAIADIAGLNNLTDAEVWAYATRELTVASGLTPAQEIVLNQCADDAKLSRQHHTNKREEDANGENLTVYDDNAVDTLKEYSATVTLGRTKTITPK